jgi:putative ATP-dependent endonuclease of OLD family
MKIQRIEISGFRSVARATFSPSDFNVFVGRNNHGKSNLFSAIEWFYTGKGSIQELRNVTLGADDDFTVEVTFGGMQAGMEQITHADNQTKLRRVIGEADEMIVRRTSATPADRFIQKPDGTWGKQPCGADSAFNNCIPRFEFVEATKNLKDVGSYKTTTPIGKMLGGVLTALLATDPTYRAFRDSFDGVFTAEESTIRQQLRELGNDVQQHLVKQFPDCALVDFEVQEPEFDDLLKNFSTKLDDGVVTDAAAKGDGMQRALMLAIIKTYADRRRAEALGRSFIFFIDEAELHLHPSAQRQLKDALLELAGGSDQVFVNTHSSVLVADDHGNQAIFCVHKEETGTTQVYPVVTALEKQEVVFELLGGTPGDILMPANILVVEGVSDRDFLRIVLKRFYAGRPVVQVTPANGDDLQIARSYESFTKILETVAAVPIYKERIALLFDQPNTAEKQTRFQTFRNDNTRLVANGQIHELPVGAIEDYYPAALVTACPHTGNKRKMAKWMGENVTVRQFEDEMPAVHAALECAWSKAYL